MRSDASPSTYEQQHHQPRHEAPERAPYHQGQRSLRPIAIPQVCNSKGAPLVRAYAPELADLGISEADFISFIDSINQKALANSTLAGLDATGSFIRKIPLPIIPLIGHGITTASKYGNAQLSKTELATHIESVNESMFAARGLRVVLCTGKVLKARLDPPGLPLLAPLQLDAPAEHQLNVWQRRIAGRKGRATAIHQTTLPMEGGGIAAKLRQSQMSSVMADEDYDLMRSRRQLLKGRRLGGRDIDREEQVAEHMLWLVVESTAAP